LAKLSILNWSLMASDELMKKEELTNLQAEQVRFVFLIIQASPEIRTKLIEDPNFIYSETFQKMEKDVKNNLNSSEDYLQSLNAPAPQSPENLNPITLGGGKEEGVVTANEMPNISQITPMENANPKLSFLEDDDYEGQLAAIIDDVELVKILPKQPTVEITTPQMSTIIENDQNVSIEGE